MNVNSVENSLIQHFQGQPVSKKNLTSEKIQAYLSNQRDAIETSIWSHLHYVCTESNRAPINWNDFKVNFLPYYTDEQISDLVIGILK